jgi:hypothetical protein
MHGVSSVRAKGAALAGLAAVVLVAVMFAPGRRAGADPGGGCNIYIPNCTVTVDPPGDPGGGGGGQGGGGGGSTSGPTDNVCHNPDPKQGCNPCPANGASAPDPGACAAFNQNLFCSQLNPQGVSPADWQAELQLFGCVGNTYTPVSPAVLAQQALATIVFPKPSGERSPSPSLLYQGLPFTYVNLWTFFWTDPATWKPLSATATLRGVSATVSAEPVELDYEPGDGGNPVACDGPGRAWTSADGNAPPSNGACAYQYKAVTAAPITSTQTIVWKITWTGTGNSAGELPSLSTSTSGQMRVLQVQVVNR